MKMNRLMKVLAVISTAIMAVSAAGVSAAADYTDTTDMVSNVEVSSGATITLEGGTAASGQTVDVPVKLHSDNRCTSYDFSIEYDPRLEFVEAGGAMYAIPYEENGHSYVALNGFKASPYKDSKAIATLTFAVPEDVQEDTNYEIKVGKIENLLLDYESFSNADAVNTVISVKGGPNVYSNGCKGDANGDGIADIRDAAAIASAVAGRNFSRFNEAGMRLGDVTEDGVLDIRDAARIAKYVAMGKVW